MAQKIALGSLPCEQLGDKTSCTDPDFSQWGRSPCACRISCDRPRFRGMVNLVRCCSPTWNVRPFVHSFIVIRHARILQEVLPFMVGRRTCSMFRADAICRQSSVHAWGIQYYAAFFGAVTIRHSLGQPRRAVAGAKKAQW
jgi:hypothetical protein